jgi:hypothetical protein
VFYIEILNNFNLLKGVLRTSIAQSLRKSVSFFKKIDQLVIYIKNRNDSIIYYQEVKESGRRRYLKESIPVGRRRRG